VPFETSCVVGLGAGPRIVPARNGFLTVFDGNSYSAAFCTSATFSDTDAVTVPREP
jgi:hypothetical protein